MSVKSNTEKRHNRAQLEWLAILTTSEYVLLDKMLYQSNLTKANEGRGWVFHVRQLSKETGISVGLVSKILNVWPFVKKTGVQKAITIEFSYDQFVAWIVHAMNNKSVKSKQKQRRPKSSYVHAMNRECSCHEQVGVHAMNRECSWHEPKKKIEKKDFKKEEEKKDSVLLLNSGSTDLEPNLQKSGSVSLFGDYFNDFGSSSSIYNKINQETKTIIERQTNIWKKSTGLADTMKPLVPTSRSVDSISVTKVNSMDLVTSFNACLVSPSLVHTSSVSMRDYEAGLATSRQTAAAAQPLNMADEFDRVWNELNGALTIPGDRIGVSITFKGSMDHPVNKNAL